MDVLIIDDEEPICLALTRLLAQEGLSAEFETKPGDGLDRVEEARVVLLDLKLPGVEGLEFLEVLLERYPRIPVVMITAHGTVEVAVEAMKLGAYHFISKPLFRDELIPVLHQALRRADGELELSDLYYDLPDEVVFRDDSSRRLLEQIRRAAGTDLTVLLEGETGVGKEVFAQLVHLWSDRAGGPFVRINCAAIPENLFESELFGHEKGAFTGAVVSKPGRAELADGGTLFLDEVGELPLTAQAKLLQFLQDHTFERLGGLRTLSADVRLVAATNRELESCVKKETFRQDLYFRLCGLQFRIPPLRERRGDIEALACHFLERFSKKYGRQLRFAPGTIRALTACQWTGNVREVEHAVEGAAALSESDELRPEDVLPRQPKIEGKTLREEKREFEKARVMRALDRCGGNRTESAQVLGISRRMLQKKLKDYGVS